MLLKIINVHYSFCLFYYARVLDIETDFQLVFWKLSLDNIYFSNFMRNLSAVGTI